MDRHDDIRSGIYVPAAVSMQMKRIEGQFAILSKIQIAAAAERIAAPEMVGESKFRRSWRGAC